MSNINEDFINNNVLKFIKIRIPFTEKWRTTENDYRVAYLGLNKVNINAGDIASSKDPNGRNIIFIGTKVGVLILYQMKSLGKIEWRSASNAHVTKFLGLKGKPITDQEVARLVSIASEEVDEMLEIASHYVKVPCKPTYIGRGV